MFPTIFFMVKGVVKSGEYMIGVRILESMKGMEFEEMWVESTESIEEMESMKKWRSLRNEDNEEMESIEEGDGDYWRLEYGLLKSKRIKE